MAQQLSTSTEQQIWHLCQRLEFFANHQPLALQKLAASSTNDNYYIHTQRGHYLLRHYAPFVEGVCRQQELRCQHAAAAVDVAPAPLCLNNHQRMLVSEFLTHSRHFDWQLHHGELWQLVSKLVSLHRLRVQTPVLDAVQYLQQLKSEITPTLWTEQDDADWKQLLAAAETFVKLPQDIVLCHMDLHSGNILLQQQKLWLIDFEYCQLADSSFDLAALSINLGMTSSEERKMSVYYLEHRAQAAAALPEKLQLAKQIYSGFCWLWYKNLPNSAAKAKRAQDKLRLLWQIAASPSTEVEIPR
ncbi:MAG: phosphotransferase [Rheinheimera sp.]